MQKIKLLIDPILKDKYGPEVSWIWRLVLTTIGYGWEEVYIDSPACDIAYLTDFKKNGKFKVYLQADPIFWDRKASLRINDIGKLEGLSHPIYGGNYSPNFKFSMNDHGVVCGRDLIFDIFWLVTGQEEKFWQKDKHGFFDLSESIFSEKQLLRQALASNIISWLEKIFAEVGFPPTIQRWPHNKRAAACMSHDVDYPEIKPFLEPLRIIGRQGISGLSGAASVLLGKRTHWHFYSWVKLEKELDLRSAFYFSAVQGSLFRFALIVPDPFYDINSEGFRALFKYLNEEGFEIGLHASYSAHKKSKDFYSEKERLERICGHEIYGNRHHYWHLNPDDVESTLMIHEEIGLKYDTSLIHEKYLGWRRGLAFPFFPFHQKKRRQLKTLQIPTVWMDDQLFGYIKFNPVDPQENLKAIINTAAEQGGCILVDVHDYVYDEVLYPGWRATYHWLLNTLVCRSDFWIASPSEIANHWMQRYHLLSNFSTGLAEGT